MLLYIILGASTKSSSNQQSGFQPAPRNIIERKRLGITHSHACIVVYIYLQKSKNIRYGSCVYKTADGFREAYTQSSNLKFEQY